MLNKVQQCWKFEATTKKVDIIIARLINLHHDNKKNDETLKNKIVVFFLIKQQMHDCWIQQTYNIDSMLVGRNWKITLVIAPMVCA